jgi:hypothetical protein
MENGKMSEPIQVPTRNSPNPNPINIYNTKIQRWAFTFGDGHAGFLFNL